MKISFKDLAGSMQPMGMLKSTRDRQQRKTDMEDQVAALKNKQAGLKNRECDTLESIAEKLELYHSYESEIAAVKKAYNLSEAMHVMDEAEERGKEIAEAAEKQKPKTEEERRKEAVEEATGTDSGLLAKLLEESVLTEKDLAEDFDFTENWEKIRERLEAVRPTDLVYSFMQEMSEASASLREEYLKRGGAGGFADSVALAAKAYGIVRDRIDRDFDDPDREISYYIGEDGALVEETREHCGEELTRAYDQYVTFLSVSKRIMTELRQRFYGEFEGVDPAEVERNTRQAYEDAISEENLKQLREEKDFGGDYRLSFSIGQEWLDLLTQIGRVH